jgi:vacuolar-type H+-ATPase subunit D/Vma8
MLIRLASLADQLFVTLDEAFEISNRRVNIAEERHHSKDRSTYYISHKLDELEREDYSLKVGQRRKSKRMQMMKTGSSSFG